MKLSHSYYLWGMPARPYPPHGGGGGEMPGRNANVNDYRHGYQGEFAEIDGRTGFNSFELRQYDARLARWMTTDLYHHTQDQIESRFAGEIHEGIVRMTCAYE